MYNRLQLQPSINALSNCNVVVGRYSLVKGASHRKSLEVSLSRSSLNGLCCPLWFMWVTTPNAICRYLWKNTDNTLKRKYNHFFTL